MLKDTASDKDGKIRAGNIKARIRMIIMYNKAAQLKGLVLSTDNYTEYMLGFWTIHGDHADYGMIQNMWKTEIYTLAYFMALEFKHTDAIKERIMLEAINAVPTDGLGITASDCEQFGVATYDEVDRILKEWLTLKRDLPQFMYYKNYNIFQVIKDLKPFLNAFNDSKTTPAISDAIRVIALMDKLKDNPVVQRHERTHFKRKWPISIPRDILGLGGYL
jgi:NAD+ synthetase